MLSLMLWNSRRLGIVVSCFEKNIPKLSSSPDFSALAIFSCGGNLDLLYNLTNPIDLKNATIIMKKMKFMVG